jgi:two-component system LytT family sensor kinase
MLFQLEKIRLHDPMNLSHSGSQSTTKVLFGYPAYWGCQLLGWSCVWAISLLHVLTEPPGESEPISLVSGIVCFVGLVCFSHFYRIFIYYNHWCNLDWRKLLPKALLASSVIAITETIFIALIHPDLHLAFLTLVHFILITAWSTVYFGYHFQVAFQKMQVDKLRLQVALREAEHRALSAQINPHFFFNSLNTVRSLIDENPEKARDAITQLARLFRASLKTSRQNLVTLREEMDTVRSYLSLEKSRFEERLIIRYDIPEELLESKLPPFLLQTLIENAIKYGVGDSPQTEISYRAYLDANGLNLQVTNPGQIRHHRSSTNSPRESTTGVGLESSHLRLHLLFGSKAFLRLNEVGDSHVRAQVLIPQTRVVS